MQHRAGYATAVRCQAAFSSAMLQRNTRRSPCQQQPVQGVADRYLNARTQLSQCRLEGMQRRAVPTSKRVGDSLNNTMISSFRPAGRGTAARSSCSLSAPANAISAAATPARPRSDRGRRALGRPQSHCVARPVAVAHAQDQPSVLTLRRRRAKCAPPSSSFVSPTR
ncbi:MAG: hypothetical protein U0074_05240 [Kouleothrix sp.]